MPGVDFYTFSTPSAGKHTLKSYTWYPALTDTNRERLTLGVGEQVSVYFDPELDMTYPETPYWLAFGGSVSPDTGSDVEFDAPINKASPTVRVIIRDVQLEKDFSVMEPTGYDPAHTYIQYEATNNFGYGNSGAGMHINVTMAPTYVSFYQVSVFEVGANASSITGYYADTNHYTNPPVNLAHDDAHGANEWYHLTPSNAWPAGDNALEGYDTPPWSVSGQYSGGGYTWIIPALWEVGSGPTNSIAGWNQQFTLGGDGTMTIQKFNLTVTRSPYSP